MKSFDDQVLDWARGKPREEEYCYTDNGMCAIGQFLQKKGICKNPHVWSFGWQDDVGKMSMLSKRMDEAVRRRPHTFGALADRLEAGR